ncbi:MAG: LLM class F420-dependent oxidoreductase [Acidobacteriota bacterium]|nr:LLM class F420-dependent oxidoreductase [Acidobacteriota bacterium]
MRIGLFGINMGALGDPDAMIQVARHAESAGLDSVWTGEHIVLPDPRVSPSPARPQTPFLDSAVALAHIAGATETLLLGTGIIILPQRNPLVLAKELATVDVVSKGRLLFGLGVGYLEPEFRALGAPFEERGAVTDECIDVLRALWTMESPAYEGQHFSFSGIDAQPRPVQQPYPPVIVGGTSKRAAARAARRGDGWYGFMTDLEATARILAWIEEHRGERQEGLGEIEISVSPPPPVTVETLEQYAELGVHRIIAVPSARAVNDMLAAVDDLQNLVG